MGLHGFRRCAVSEGASPCLAWCNYSHIILLSHPSTKVVNQTRGALIGRIFFFGWENSFEYAISLSMLGRSTAVQRGCPVIWCQWAQHHDLPIARREDTSQLACQFHARARKWLSIGAVILWCTMLLIEAISNRTIQTEAPQPESDDVRPGKKRKLEHPLEKQPNVIKLVVTSDNEHLVAVTAEDKCVRVFQITPSGELEELSQR